MSDVFDDDNVYSITLRSTEKDDEGHVYIKDNL